MTSVTKNNITGLILAGGKSTRFGNEDKAAYKIAGRPMIHHVYQQISQITPNVLLSVRDLNQTDYDLPVTKVEDKFKDAGPLAGLHAGILASKTDWILLVACDLPFLTTASLKQLIHVPREEAKVVVGKTADGRQQPLCALYHKNLLPVIEENLSAGRRAMYHLIKNTKVAEFKFAESDLHNINRLSDLDFT